MKQEVLRNWKQKFNEFQQFYKGKLNELREIFNEEIKNIEDPELKKELIHYLIHARDEIVSSFKQKFAELQDEWSDIQKKLKEGVDSSWLIERINNVFENAKKEIERPSYRCAEIYLKLGEKNKSAEYFEKAGMYEEAAKIYEELRIYQKAAKNYERAGKLEPALRIYSELKDYQKISEISEKLGRFEKIGKYYEKLKNFEKNPP